MQIVKVIITGGPDEILDAVRSNVVEAVRQATANLAPQFQGFWNIGIEHEAGEEVLVIIENRHHQNTFDPCDVGGDDAYQILRDASIDTFGELADQDARYLRQVLGLSEDALGQIQTSLRNRRLAGDPKG